MPLLLFLAIALSFYFIFGNEPPVIKGDLKIKIIGLGAQILTAILLFVLGSTLFKTPLAGIVWGFMGWHMPLWLQEHLEKQRKKKIKESVNNFITTASSMYMANMLTSEVVRTLSDRVPEPLASDFKEMIGRRNVSASASYADMFNDLHDKYDIKEFKAISSIVGAADRAGGPKAAGKGLRRLSLALRLEEKLETERIKATSEAKISFFVVLGLLGVGLALDITSFSSFFEEGLGPIFLAVTSAVFVGMVFIYRKVMVD